MRMGSYGLIVVGVILAILGIVNLYVIKLHPFQHITAFVVGAGGVLALVGLVLYFMSGRASATAG